MLTPVSSSLTVSQAFVLSKKGRADCHLADVGPFWVSHVCIPVLTLLNYLALEQEDITCQGLRGRCVGVCCLGQWVVCATVTDVQDCDDVNVSNMMFISQRKPPFGWCQKQLDLAHTVVCMSSC